jgi:hypothetical protein
VAGGVVSGTPKALLRALELRDGHVSAWTGEDCPELVPQHRQGGMGGRRDKHRLENVVWLESSLNGLIESDANLQREAISRGIKVASWHDPKSVPVRFSDGWYWLTDNTRIEVPELTALMRMVALGIRKDAL